VNNPAPGKTNTSKTALAHETSKKEEVVEVKRQLRKEKESGEAL
jgi:hypothetical protein